MFCHLLLRNYLKKCSKINYNALFFYRSKTILDLSKLFLTRPNCFGYGSKCEIISEKLLSDRSKTFWTGPKQFGRIQNSLGLLEGQGINLPRLPIVPKVWPKNACTNSQLQSSNSLVLVKRQWWQWILRQFSYPYYPCFWPLVLYWA